MNQYNIVFPLYLSNIVSFVYMKNTYMSILIRIDKCIYFMTLLQIRISNIILKMKHTIFLSQYRYIVFNVAINE